MKACPASSAEAYPSMRSGWSYSPDSPSHVSAQGQGHGRDLLVAAVEEAAAAGQHAAARFIAVDPIDENARRFYAKFGFLDIRGDAGERMFMRIDRAIATFSTLET